MTMDTDDDEIVYEVDEVQGADIPVAGISPSPSMIFPAVLQSTPTLAAMALAITSESWNDLGNSTDKAIAPTSDMHIIVERITSLLLIRTVAVAEQRKAQAEESALPYSDLSTTTICKTALKKKKSWSKPITTMLISQLRKLVRRICEQYRSNVYYHNVEHCYHVVISANKLLDLMLCPEESSTSDDKTNKRLGLPQKIEKTRKTFGLKSDPLQPLALLFSALAHDVEHKGISNQQLVNESDALALLYNDQSVAEQRSLAVAFSELMKEEYKVLRSVWFENQEEYKRFRKIVINLVLTTDLASPERTQIVKSKWKEAFGEVAERKEEKQKMIASRRSLFAAMRPKPNRASSLPPSWNGQQKPSHASSSRSPSTRNTSSAEPQSSISNTSLMTNHTGATSGSMMTQFSDLTDGTQPLPHATIYGPIGRSLKEGVLADIEDEDESESPSVSSEDLDEEIEFNKMALRNGVGKSDSFTQISMEAQASQLTLDTNEKRRWSFQNVPRRDKGLKSTSEGKKSGQKHKEHLVNMDEMLHRSWSKPSKSDHSARGDSQSTSGVSCSPAIHQKLRNSVHGYLSPSQTSSRKIRLGIQRSMDFTGEQIQPYSSSRSLSSRYLVSANASMASQRIQNESSHTADSNEDIEWDPDEPDELKAIVVLEQFIKAADVSPHFQGWGHMAKWSSRLFFELKASCHAGRGMDPEGGWYEGQISFLENYSLPLSRQLQETGVFGEKGGELFGRTLIANRDRWLVDGLALTTSCIQEWDQILKQSKSNDAPSK